MEIQNGVRRTEFGHEWEGKTEEVDETGSILPHWHSTAGTTVRVFPPRFSYNCWVVAVGDMRDDEKILTFTGHDAEKLAFAVGEGFTRVHY